MLMSILATSSAVAGRPNFGGAMSVAMAALTAIESAAPRPTLILDIDVAHLAVGRDRPALYRIEVEALPRRILRGPVGVGLLHKAFFIGRAAHQCYGLAVPHPGQPETRQCFGQNRARKRRFRPALPAIGG